MSEPVDVSAISEGLNFQKVLSLSKSELEARLQRPKFVPEKLDFRLYEKFEGYMLVNWYLSELNEDNPIRTQLGMAELKLLASQFCTHLLAAGVLKQLPDPGVQPTNIFRLDCIYFWSHAEVPQSQPQTPGKLSSYFWPPSSPCDVMVSPSDVSESSACKQITLHHDKKTSARDVEILSLEEEINYLRQEVDKYKTLIEIQNLTASAVKDFGSPSRENVKNDNYSANTNNYVSILLDKGTSPAYNVSEKSTQIQIEVQHAEIQTEIEERTIEKSIQTEEISFEQVFQPTIIEENETLSFCQPPLSVPPPPLLNISSPSVITSCIPSPPPPPPVVSSCISRPSPVVSSSIPPPPPLPLQIDLSKNLASSLSVPAKTIPPPPPAPPFPGLSPPPPLPCPELPPPPPPCPGLPPPPPPCPGLPPLPPPMSGTADYPKLSFPAGPLPMPVPPLGGFNPQKAAMRKTPINPPVPMKPLYWTRILVAQATKNDDGPILWNEIEELPIDVLPEDFAKLFSRQVIARTPMVKKEAQKPKVEVVKLLDSKRSQSVGILAQSLRQDFHEIENAIYSFDTSVVSLESLQQIYEVRASPEELSLINEHLKARPDTPLDKPEQFLYDLSQIANFAERITCLTFQVEFEDAITTISHTLDNFRSTCEFIMQSPELKRVLALILTMGNYMNGGNVARGQADGFGLEVLSRLKDVKGIQAGVTLLHFVVSAYTRNPSEDDKPPPLPVPEPGDVRRAMALDFDVVKGELHRLKNKLAECEKRTDNVIISSSPDNLQPFKDKMEVFLDKSKTQLVTEFESLEECHKLFISMMNLYLFKPKCENLETYAPSGFFELWLQFCVDFKDIYKKEIIRIQLERAQELKRKECHETNIIKERENGLKSKFKKARARLSDRQIQEGGQVTP